VTQTQAELTPPADVPPVALDLGDDFDETRPYIAYVLRAILDSAGVRRAEPKGKP
jgi:hypothetical protein